MSQSKNELNGAMAAAEPLFASVWLALFYEIRKNFVERRSMKSTDTTDSHELNKK